MSKDEVVSKRSAAGHSSDLRPSCCSNKKQRKASAEGTPHHLSINRRYMQEDMIERLRRGFTSASVAAGGAGVVVGSTSTLDSCNTATTTITTTSSSTTYNNNMTTSARNNNNNSSNRSTEHSSDTCEKVVNSSAPFVHCVLPEFISEDHCLDTLQGELQEVTFNEKNNDLYNFHQSFDLAQNTSPQITAFRQLFYTDVLEWMKKVTDIELTDVVDLFCSIYEYTDVLLCHDDQLEGRRIAFILYLVPPWDPTGDGGTLDLFTTNEARQPTKVVKSVQPAWNQFTFFEVSPKSFHQVSEVLSKEKTRLSVSGWFHGPSLPPQLHVVAQPNKLPLYPSLESETELLFAWVNPSYLDLEVQSEIREKFELESEIQLQDFLKPEKYSAVNDAFLQSDIEWIHRGPANQRNYHAADSGTLPGIITDCLRFLQSEIVFLFLSNLTGLKLHRDATVSSDEDDGGDDDGDGDGDDGGDDGGGDGGKGKEDGDAHHSSSSIIDSSSSSSSATEVRTSVGQSRRVPAEDATREAALKNGTSGSGAEGVARVSPSDRRSFPRSSSSPRASRSPSFESAEQQRSVKVTKTAETSKHCPPGITAAESATEKGTSVVSSSEASCSQEVRMWSHGSYTLLQDTEAKSADYALDTFLFFGCEGWQPDYGGYISYIVNGEDEELLTVSPAHNSLALVYRDSETLRFVKHINHRITSMPNTPKFFDISFIYYE